VLDEKEANIFAGRAAGVIEAKKAGITLIGVETQSDKYTKGLPDGFRPGALRCLFVTNQRRMKPDSRIISIRNPGPVRFSLFINRIISFQMRGLTSLALKLNCGRSGILL